MAYLVLAYPELTSESFDRIQSYRKDNDELFFNVVNPHFTIVFPVCGTISRLTIARYEDDVVTTIEEIKLK